MLKGQKVKGFLNQTKRTKPKCSEEKLPSVTMFRAQFSHRLHFHPSLTPSLLHPPLSVSQGCILLPFLESYLMGALPLFA